jgi:hypothetical protein
MDIVEKDASNYSSILARVFVAPVTSFTEPLPRDTQTDEMGSSVVIYTPSLIKIGSVTRKLIGVDSETH